MTRRLNLPWPDAAFERARGGQPLRLLAVSDEPDRALDFESNRAGLGRLDALLGCGDLEPDYLAFLADAFCVPLLYVRGNHDRGAGWESRREHLPRPLGRPAQRIGGATLVGLSWPGDDGARALRDDLAAWRQALGLVLRPPRGRPLIMLSHVPPEGLGDSPEDAYHRGFGAYHWLCRRLDPVLWLHGHTTMAAKREWRVRWGSTTLVNVTGAVLVQIGEDAPAGANIAAEMAGSPADRRQPGAASAEAD